MAWSWYCVKTLYRWRATGEPDNPDQDFDPDASLIEERIVLIKARSFDEAIEKAEKEAHKYAKQPIYENLYGQTVRTKYLECCEAFELYDPPAANIEIYSATEIVSTKVKDAEIVDRKMGKKESARMFR